jgi:hypothetical protein
MIAPSVGCRALWRCKNGRDLARFEILDEARSCALERDRHDPLAQVQMLRIGRRDEPREGVDRREPGVPRRRAVAALAFQVLEESNDLLRRDVLEVESHDGKATTLCEETQEKRERVAIAANRMRAHAAYHRQVLSEKGAECTGERRRTRLHRFVPRGVKIARQ